MARGEQISKAQQIQSIIDIIQFELECRQSSVTPQCNIEGARPSAELIDRESTEWLKQHSSSWLQC